MIFCAYLKTFCMIAKTMFLFCLSINQSKHNVLNARATNFPHFHNSPLKT